MSTMFNINRSFVTFLVCVAAGVVAAMGPTQQIGIPIKLGVQATPMTISVGSKAEITVNLLDAKSQAVKNAKEYEIEIQVKPQSGKTTSQKVKVKSWESSVKQTFQFNEVGLTEIIAKNPEMRNGSLFINVKAASTFKIYPKLPVPKPTPKPRSFTGHTERPMWINAIFRPNEWPTVGSFFEPMTFIPADQQTNGDPLKLMLLGPSDSFLANGESEARIQLFLDNGFFAGDIRVRLSTNLGRLKDELIVIPGGTGQAESVLTSKTVGKATVKIESVFPRVPIESGQQLIRFVPPITKLDVVSSPPKILQVEQAEWIVRLMGDDGNAITTDEPREVTLAIESGRGDISPTKISIPAGSFEGRAKFQPAGTGVVTVNAVSNKLPTGNGHIEVSLAKILLLWSAIGGIAGGLIAFFMEKGKWWRLIVGALTGNFLYWAFLFQVLPFLPQSKTINSFSAFAISMAGGFAGPGVFDLINLVTGKLKGAKKQPDSPPTP